MDNLRDKLKHNHIFIVCRDELRDVVDRSNNLINGIHADMKTKALALNAKANAVDALLKLEFHFMENNKVGD